MTEFYAGDDEQARVRWSITDALRRYGTDAARLSHVFAGRHDLQPADVRALVAIMSAEGGGTPLTAGQLRDHLGLSSGGTSLVIDRLEAAGHIRRTRDHPTDSRVVHLRYTRQGMATGLAFFGPLGERTNTIMDQFTEDELAVIAQFLSTLAESLHEHVRELEGGGNAALGRATGEQSTTGRRTRAVRRAAQPEGDTGKREGDATFRSG
jgi:DNA-binding MarR family transcriptional regulator